MKDYLSSAAGFIVATIVVGVSLIAPVIIYYYLFGYGAYSR